MIIREYESNRDSKQLRECFVELQDFERSLYPSLREGDVVADSYLQTMFARSAESCGKVFIAEVGGAVVGFVSVWAKVRQMEFDEDPSDFAYVSDLVVRAAHRGQGLGRALLDRAESYAREQQASILKVGVLFSNLRAKQLYYDSGYSDHHLELQKRLTPDAADIPRSKPR